MSAQETYETMIFMIGASYSSEQWMRMIYAIPHDEESWNIEEEANDPDFCTGAYLAQNAKDIGNVPRQVGLEFLLGNSPPEPWTESGGHLYTLGKCKIIMEDFVYTTQNVQGDKTVPFTHYRTTIRGPPEEANRLGEKLSQIHTKILPRLDIRRYLIKML